MNSSVLEPPSDGSIPVDSHRKLLAYTVGSDEVELPFTLRLAKENGW